MKEKGVEARYVNYRRWWRELIRNSRPHMKWDKLLKKKVKKRKNVKAKNDAPPRRPAPTKKKTEKVSSTDSREADSRSKKPPKIRHYAASIYKGVCGKSKTKWTWRCTFITTLSSAAHPFHYV